LKTRDDAQFQFGDLTSTPARQPPHATTPVSLRLGFVPEPEGGITASMRTVLVALCLVLIAAVAHAQTVETLDVYEYGVYASSPRVAVGRSQQGIVRYQADRIDLVETTRTIVAHIGGQFGFRYRLTGRPMDAGVPLTIVTRFPAPGILAPKGSVPFVRDVDTVTATLGGSNFLTWPFERRSDLVPGLWTIEIWQGTKKLGEQQFNVILPPIS